MTRCLECVRLEGENQRLRELVAALWLDARERWRMHHGYGTEPALADVVMGLRMWSGEVIEPESEAA